MAGIVSAANLGGIADPRLSMEPDAIGSKELETNNAAFAQATRRRGSSHSTNITFEEYHYWAKLTRAHERTSLQEDTTKTSVWKLLAGRLQSKATRQQEFTRRTSLVPSTGQARHDKSSSSNGPAEDLWSVVTEEEWYQASRAARTATWGAVFYLITTDILGPFSVPYAIGQLGYGPGFALYLVFAIMAAYSGVQLWQQFLGLDSDKYPVKNYGDLALRIFGQWARYIANVLQSFQFFMNVAVLTVTNGQSLAQLAAGPNGTGFICFVVAEVIFMVLGFVLGQIRTLQRLSYLANVAVWMNVFILFVVMGVAASSEPNYSAVETTSGIAPDQPIVHSAGLPEGKDLVHQINGLMQAVYSYGGATLFCELMAEMRKPWDFWKGLICADVFIFSCYIIFGMVVYAEQGQYAYNPAYQGLSPYAWQTVGNVFGLLTGVIAAILYGNIGIKVLYANLGRELLRFPILESKGGKIIWVCLVPFYWALAFIVAAAIPQVSNLQGFVGAACILQFTYTFPPILMVFYNIQRDAITETETFDPATGLVSREDVGVQRYWRGFRKRMFRNSLDIIYFLGALTTAALGLYSSVIGMNSAFMSSPITPFTCVNPAG